MVESLLLAVALAMDSFAVALTQGARFRPSWRGGLLIALTFGLFQAGMPLIGWGLGKATLSYLAAIDHWIAFGLLSFLGARMLGGYAKEADASERLTGLTLLIAGFATSIDALAVGFTMPAMSIARLPAAALIGAVTFVLSGAGAAIGRAVGDLLGPWAERLGGIILIALGVAILVEHLG